MRGRMRRQIRMTRKVAILATLATAAVFFGILYLIGRLCGQL